MTRLANVNTTDLRAAIELGCRCMSRVFNRDDDGIPFFSSTLRPSPRLSFSSCHSEAHVPGRHLNALLNAEAVGVPVAEEAVEQHARAAFFSYSGALPLPLNREAIGGPLVNFCPHNIREGFHALTALAVYRGSREALELAERSIACIRDTWSPEAGWDRERLAGLGLADQGWSGTFITGIGRCIGPLVKLHRGTGSAAALSLAKLLAEKALDEFFTTDGAYDGEAFGTHVHSTTCVMSSLAQLADLFGDEGMMGRVRAFYDHGLWEIRDEIGWSLENSRAEAHPDFGECNNTGDILETALLLGKWADEAYYDDAERILRCHLLPAQLRDNSFVVEPPNPNGEDGLRDLADRHLGAFGFPAPYGHAPVGMEWLSFNMDIVGGAVGSLCAAVREVVTGEAGRACVNLLFDHETEAVRVESPYTHETLAVTVKQPLELLTVRLPGWAARESVRLEAPPVGERVEVRFPLAEREIVLKHRTREMRVRLRGDEVVAMDNFGADLTFFADFGAG